jgi:hypothetical protein
MHLSVKRHCLQDLWGIILVVVCESGEIVFGVAGCEMLIQQKKLSMTIFLKYLCVYEV